MNTNSAKNIHLIYPCTFFAIKKQAKLPESDKGVKILTGWPSPRLVTGLASLNIYSIKAIYSQFYLFYL